MKRKIVQIDSKKCNGCGLCAKICHENAIGMVNDKAVLLRDDYCDGLGDCLPACPVGAISFLECETVSQPASDAQNPDCTDAEPDIPVPANSQLRQWPVQIKLAPLNAPYYDDAQLLIAADCAAYAFARFHEQHMKNRITLIGCPKLDNVDYSEKLTAILQGNQIKSVTIVRMEVYCCRGLENATMQALKRCGKSVPCQVITLSTDGHVLDE